MTAIDIWLKNLNALENAWNEFLKSGKVNGNDDQQLHNNIIIYRDHASTIYFTELIY